MYPLHWIRVDSPGSMYGKTTAAEFWEEDIHTGISGTSLCLDRIGVKLTTSKFLATYFDVLSFKD